MSRPNRALRTAAPLGRSDASAKLAAMLTVARIFSAVVAKLSKYKSAS
jgi:hypothetical protein